MNAQFRLFDTKTGLPINFLVEEGETPDVEWAQQLVAGIDSLLASELFVTQQPVQEGQEEGAKTEQIVGYVLGKGMDRKLDKPMPKLYLYVSYRPFAAYTIFHEYISYLPADLQKEIAPFLKAFDEEGTQIDLAPGQLQAPAKEQAQQSGIYKDCNLTITVTPAKQHDGSVKRNSGGYIIYEYKPNNNNGATKPDASQNVNGSTGAQTQTQAMTAEQHPIFHALGTALYGDTWNEKRIELTEFYGSKRNPPADIKSSKDLTKTETTQLIRGMEEKIRSAIKGAHQEMRWSTNDLVAAMREADTPSNNLTDLHGVPLSKLARVVARKLDSYRLGEIDMPTSNEIPF